MSQPILGLDHAYAQFAERCYPFCEYARQIEDGKIDRLPDRILKDFRGGDVLCSDCRQRLEDMQA